MSETTPAKGRKRKAESRSVSRSKSKSKARSKSQTKPRSKSQTKTRSKSPSKTRSKSPPRKLLELDEELRPLAGPAFGDYTLCDDAVDPVSQEVIWEEAGGKRTASGEIRFLFSWTEEQAGRSYVRALSAVTLARMLRQSGDQVEYGSRAAESPRKRKKEAEVVVRHPMSGVALAPADVERGRRMLQALDARGLLELEPDDLAELKEDELTKEKVKHFATSVCQLFSCGGLFIDEQAFTGLTAPQLTTLISELKDMFAHNFSDAQQRELANTDGPTVTLPFQLTASKTSGLLVLQHLVLKEVQRVITQAKEGHVRAMALYVLLGGLAVVSQDVRERYLGSLSHAFQLP